MFGGTQKTPKALSKIFLKIIQHSWAGDKGIHINQCYLKDAGLVIPTGDVPVPYGSRTVPSKGLSAAGPR